MRLNLRQKITGLIGVLSVLLVALASIDSYSKIRLMQDELLAQQINAAADKLVVAAGSWAVERGTTAGVLGGGGAPTPKQLETILARRELADGNLTAAIAEIEAIGADVGVDEEIRATLAAHEAVKAIRERVDAVFAVGSLDGDPGLRADWFPAITDLIMSSAKLREREEVKLIGGLPKLAIEAVRLRDHAWLWAEYAGRERGRLAGVISSGQPMTPQVSSLIDQFSGFIGSAISGTISSK